VWGHVTGLLSDPLRLLGQFEGFVQACRDGDAQERARRRHLDGQLAGLAREEVRQQRSPVFTWISRLRRYSSSSTRSSIMWNASAGDAEKEDEDELLRSVLPAVHSS
jgi:hypothetical protein